MKKLLLPLAVAAALPSFAQAQTSVTLYGLGDLSINSVNSGNAARSSKIAIESGVIGPSRWGIRGSEDLGGGLSAVFNFEAGFAADTGAADNPFFQRRSVVGLGGNFGTVLLGRDYTPGFQAGGVTDILGYGYWGNLLGFTAGGPFSGITTRASNGIHYTSPTWGGFSIKAMYASGENDVAPKTAGNVQGFAALYGAGPISGQAYYQTSNDAAANKNKQAGIGGGYNFGAFRVVAGYYSSKLDINDFQVKAFNIGGAFAVGPGEIKAQVISMKETNTGLGPDPKNTTFGIAYDYNLSKRTKLYASYGRSSNNSTGQWALFASGTLQAAIAAGDDPRALGFGIFHTF
jgi:predicted porin